MPTVEELLDDLPAAGDEAALFGEVRRAVAASGRVIVVLDDDPTGVQTVHDVAVLATWSIDELTAELRYPATCFFILTNSRSLAESDAAALNREIAANLREASARTGRPFVIVSRSDSTLRGHFPAETDALAAALGVVDGVILCPVFFEGGRITVDDVHYLREGERFVPVGETEFARDAAFGYAASNLREWVAEKSGGSIEPEHVASISIQDLRVGGPLRVAGILRQTIAGRPIVLNAACYADLEIAALGAMMAEDTGTRLIYRTGASFVRARAGITARPQLTRADLLGTGTPPYVPGMVVVGSHVKRSTEQLRELLTLSNVAPIEVDVREIVKDAGGRDRLIAEATSAVTAALSMGLTPVVFTSRDVAPVGREDSLIISRSVSDALVRIVRAVDRRPGFIIGKGGITSSDIGTKALGARRAVVLGQIRPGVPVWRLGQESRFPDLPYVVFPGNVGGPETLAEIVAELRSREG